MFILLSLSLVAGARKKPIIGITPSGYNSPMSSYIGRSYTDAIMRAGGIPVVLPQVSDAASAAEMVSYLDGILFTGGEDLAPSYYGEEILNDSVSIDEHRDTIDILYARAALDRRLPILAICRGEQLMNVVLGGSLYQDLPTQKPSDIAHRQKTDSRFPTHRISVSEGSTLHRVMMKRVLEVNTSHHQAVKTPSDKVAVTALADDGVVEAYESADKGQWLLAVQFHPEQLVRADDSWLELFKAFVKACK